MVLTPFITHFYKFILLRRFLFRPSIMSATTKRQLSEKDNERIAEIHMELTQWRHKEHMRSPEKDRVPFRVPALEEAENEYLRRREAKKRRKKEKTGTVKKETRGRILVMERSGPGKPPADTERHKLNDARKKIGEGIRSSVAKLSQAGQATVEGGAREEGSGGSNDSNINGDDTLFDCDTETQFNSPLVEGGAGEEGSGGSNDSNINGDDTLFDCDTEAPINSPLATAMDKATGSDGKVGTPSFAGEIPRINIAAGEGQGTIRFAFVNNRMEILRSPPATTSPPATIQLRRQDAVLTPPSATSPRSGKINPPDLAGPVPRKLHHKNDRQDCESSNTSPPELAAALTQAPPFGNSWPVDATGPRSGKINPPDLAGPVPRKLHHKNDRQDCESSNTSPPELAAALTQAPPFGNSWPVDATGRTHPSNFAGPPVREENSSISQATETSRELSANLRKQAQTSQIELAEWGDHLGVVPIQEQLDELESERLRRMRERSDIIRMGQALGVVTTHEELDREESERLLRMRFVEREQKRREARLYCGCDRTECTSRS